MGNNISVNKNVSYIKERVLFSPQDRANYVMCGNWISREVITYNKRHKEDRRDLYMCARHHLCAQEDQCFPKAADLGKIMEDVGQMLQVNMRRTQ